LPNGWVPLHFVEAEEQALMLSIEQMTHEALLRPTGTFPFQMMLSGVKSIAIIVDDGTHEKLRKSTESSFKICVIERTCSSFSELSKGILDKKNFV